MSEEPVQIFVSYARLDDVAPPESPDALGFVTALCDQLNFEFKSHGHPRPRLWHDIRKIEKADQFEPRLTNALNASKLLVVVLSSNWMESVWCRRELDTFAERWKHDRGLRERIIVVAKRHIELDRRPSLLQGQPGFNFYTRDDADEPGLEREYYVRGRARDRRYYDQLEELAGVLWRRARRVGKAETIAPPGPETKPVESTPATAKPASDRTIYLAKPATDMEPAYDSMVKELSGRNYRIVPDPATAIPSNSTALAFVDAAMAQAEISIHLLGEKHGYTPEDRAPIVDLQLARAAERSRAAAAGQGAPAPAFRRIIWAPEILDPDLSTSTPVVDRSHKDVLADFGGMIETDKIEAQNLSRFVGFVSDFLVRNAPPGKSREIANAGERIYLCHSREDSDYAQTIADLLESRKLEPVFPVFDGPPDAVTQFHLEQLAKCDAVVLCWASASEWWTRAHASELRDYHKLGRSAKFAYRSVIAGPPPGDRKKRAPRNFSKSEIDIVIDLTATAQPTPDALGPLFATSD